MNPTTPIGEVKLGTRVQFSVYIERKFGDAMRNEFGYFLGYKKFWKLIPGKIQEGIVVGIRNLSDGRTERVPEGQDGYYIEKSFKAYLIATDLRRKPVFVKVEDANTISI